MVYSTLKTLIKKIPFFWTLLRWLKDRALILLRLKDVLMMMILFHIWPEQTYRFATRKTLPSKKNRFSQQSKEIIPFDLIKSKSTDMPLMEEINVVGIGSSFDLNNLKNLKGPIFHPGWGVLRMDKNGKIFYKHLHLYEDNITLDVAELFDDKGRASASVCLQNTDDPLNPTLRMVPHDLLSAMWLQFALAVEGNRNYEPCDECHSWMEIAPGSGRPDKKFCSSACSMRAYRKRKKKGSSK